MSDPERLLESHVVDTDVRDLLESLRRMKPERSGLQTWGAMAAKLAKLPTVVPAPGTGVHPSIPVAAGASKAALALKIGVIAVTAAMVGTGALWVRSVDTLAEPAPSAALTAPVAMPDPPSTEAAPAPDAPTPKPENSAPQMSRSSRLEAEASLLAKARVQLRGGSPEAALSTLSKLQREFPSGALTQERDVVTVEALAASGNASAAAHKAQAFIAAHPTSPHSATLQRFVEAK
jgi:hypothetical protein